MNRDNINFQDLADQTFDRLHTIWFAIPRDSKRWKGDIWRKGNTLSAVLNYWKYTQANSARRDNAIAIIKDGWQFYEKNKAGGWWVDDYGWWAMFILDVHAYISSFGPNGLPFSTQQMVDEAKYCHMRMTKNLDSQGGGIWNVMNDSQSRRNTITNALYWALSSGLANIGAGSNYATDANNWFKWLLYGDWNGGVPIGDWGLFESIGVVRETAVGAQRPDKENKDWYWSGDQGTLLRALVNYRGLVTDPSLKEKLEDIGRKLITITTTNSGPFVDQKGILHESPSPANYSADYANDYATGKGVFLRHLVTFAHNVQGNVEVPIFVNRQAQAAWDSRNQSTNEAARDWNPGFGPPAEDQPVDKSDVLWPQVLQTGGLDAIVAALRMGAKAESEEIPATTHKLPPGTIVITGHTSSGPGVIRVDPESGTQTTLPSGVVFAKTVGVAVEGDGNILVTGDGLVRINPVTGATTGFSGGLFSDPFGVAVEADGSIVIADSSAFGGSGGVIRVHPVTGAQTTVSSGGAFRSPLGVAVEADGTILITDPFAYSTGRALRVNPVTGAQTPVSAGGVTLLGGVAVEADGKILIVGVPTAASGGLVIRVDPVAGTQTTVSSGGALLEPVGVAVEASGEILVADQSAFGGSGGVIRVDPVTGAQNPVSSGGRPQDIAVVA